MMRKFLTGAALAVAAIVTPNVAAADGTTVGLSVGSIDPDGPGDFDLYALNGGWNHSFGNGWAVQADGTVAQADLGGSAEIGASYGSLAVGLRNDTYSLYGFAGLADTLVLGTSGTFVGLGGEFYAGNFVVGGSYGHEDIDAFDVSIDSFDLTGAYYFTPNFGLNAQVGTGSIDTTTGDGDINNYGVGAVFRLSSSPIAFNAKWRHDDADGGGELDSWMLGVNLNFGTDSAQEQATHGPSWNGAEAMFERTLTFF